MSLLITCQPPLSSSGGSVRRTVDGSRLTLTDVTTNDMGNYACNATTATAYVYDQATLTVMREYFCY